jgi:hypothetical protein
MKRRRMPPYRITAQRSVPSTRRKSQSIPPDRLKIESAEQVAKALGLLGILLYIVGLLSVNGYLQSFGVSDFSLVRTRFVLTGVLIATSALTCSIPLVIRPMRREFKKELRKEREKRERSGANRWRTRMLFLLIRSGWFAVIAGIWFVTLLTLFVYAQPISERDVERLVGAIPYGPRNLRLRSFYLRLVGSLVSAFGRLLKRRGSRLCWLARTTTLGSTAQMSQDHTFFR